MATGEPAAGAQRPCGSPLEGVRPQAVTIRVARRRRQLDVDFARVARRQLGLNNERRRSDQRSHHEQLEDH